MKKGKKKRSLRKLLIIPPGNGAGCFSTVGNRYEIIVKFSEKKKVFLLLFPSLILNRI